MTVDIPPHGTPRREVIHAQKSLAGCKETVPGLPEEQEGF